MTCDKTTKCAEPCGLCPEQWPVPAGSEVPTLADRLSDEADQCRNDGAEDIAKLLDEAAEALHQSQPMIPLSAMRPVAVEAIRAVTGCPDIKGNGLYLVDELESVAKAAALSTTPANQSPAEAHEKPVAFVRHTWNRSGARSLVFEKPDELSLAEEATGVEYEPLYAAAHARRSDAGAAVEARRYRRLQILGAAPFGSKNLDTGTVLRFQSLDAFVDADISAHPSRGESAQPEAAQPQPKGMQAMPDSFFAGMDEDYRREAWRIRQGVKQSLQAPAPGADSASAEGTTFYLVLAPNGLEGVAFTDKADARYAATGRRSGFGVSTIAEAFRDAYDEADSFETVEVRAAAPAPAVGAQKGWTLVPVEPTDEMLIALFGYWLAIKDSPKQRQTALAEWACMLAAAPEAPAQPAGVNAELLEALIDTLDALECWTGSDVRIGKARAAIDAAMGVSHVPVQPMGGGDV